MLECMHSLGNRINGLKCKDFEYEFYDKFLSEYENLESDEELIKVDDEKHIVFSNLNNLYSSSKDIFIEERNCEEKLADSFMFYVSAGVIKLIKGRYFIVLDKLNMITQKYNEIDEEEKGISYSKGAK